MTNLGHGQVWWADLDKVRPVLVVTRASVASLLTRVVVAPITTVVRGLIVEVTLGPDEGVVEGSVANFDNIELVPVNTLLAQAGSISAERWGECCRAMTLMMACPG